MSNFKILKLLRKIYHPHHPPSQNMSTDIPPTAPKVYHGLVCDQPRNRHMGKWGPKQLQGFRDDSPKLQGFKFLFTWQFTIGLEFCWIWWGLAFKSWPKISRWFAHRNSPCVVLHEQDGTRIICGEKTCLNTRELLQCVKHEVLLLPQHSVVISIQSKVKNLSPTKYVFFCSTITSPKRSRKSQVGSTWSGFQFPQMALQASKHVARKQKTLSHTPSYVWGWNKSS